MRIGIDARLNGYRGGGISEYNRYLIAALADLDHSNEYVILHAARAQVKTDLLDTASGKSPNFCRVNVYTPCHHKLERWTLGGEISRLRLDVLHSPDFIPPKFGAKRKVITVHDLNFLHYPQFQTPDSLSYYAGNIRAAVQEADHILTVSQSGVNDLVNLLNVPAEKISVQVEGVGTAYFPMPASEVNTGRSKRNLPSSYILFVGTFEPRKNLPGLFEAYHRLRQQFADAPPLVLVGRRGWLYETIFQKVDELKLHEHLIWLEDLPMDELPVVYNGASVLVLPSFYEGFGLPALESMACGVPTIVSNRGSLPEVVGEAGLLVNPDQPDSITEGMRQMLTNTELRNRCREMGLIRATHFTWRRAAETALHVYGLNVYGLN